MKRISYKYRIYPTIHQEQTLIEWLGQLRFIWNKLLEINNLKYETEKKFEFKYEMKKRLPGFKKEYNWINAPAHALQNTVFALDTAINRCVIDKISEFPKFKHKNTSTSGIKIDQVNEHIDISDRYITIPKLGKVEIRKHREHPDFDKLTSITIKKEGTQWYVVCLFKTEDIQSRTDFSETEIVGLDLGLLDFATLSDGEMIEAPKFFVKSQKKLKQKQRQVRKCLKGSKNQRKKYDKIAKIHRKVKNQRRDFHHKQAHAIAKQYGVVVVENLNIAGMIKNRHRSKSIADVGWGNFIIILNWHLYKKGGILYKVDRFFPSTKRCSSCHEKRNISLEERTYICNSCGLIIGRDLNAAYNLKEEGMNCINRAGIAQIYACGDTAAGEQSLDWSRYVSMKQEAPFL